MSGALPCIFGLESTALSAQEEALFRTHLPLGYILFTRNCDTPAQLSALCASLHVLHEGTGAPPLILIDQEGGRVARLREPYWETPPAPGTFATMAGDQGLDVAIDAASRQAEATARTLRRHGINVNCVPMCDIRYPHSHAIIGDRAYGEEPAQIIALARAVAQAHQRAGVLPVLKHLPGHGRATVDSHESLPVVDCTMTELAIDIEPFQALSDLPLGMTAHIVYTALDAERPATLSPTVIRFIREQIGFNGLLMSDDLCMKALSGDVAELTQQTLDAGCDIVLHCNGELPAMERIARAATRYPTIPAARIAALFS